MIPTALVDAEVAHPECTELRVLETMHQRKRAFTDLADGFFTLPGGTGTMDELWEAMSWARVGLLNVAGRWCIPVAPQLEDVVLPPGYRDAADVGRDRLTLTLGPSPSTGVDR